MAEDPKQSASPPEQQDTDVLFKLQVEITEFFLKNAKYGVYVAVAALLGAAGWGGYSSWRESRIEKQFESIAAVDFLMPQPDPMSEYGLAPRDDKSDAARMANLEEGARRFEAAAKGCTGSAATYGWLKAADAWDRAGKADARLAALKAATETGATDLPAYAADMAYAGALVDAGKTDEALAHYRAAVGRQKGFYAAQALGELARAQVAAGKSAEAKATIEELKAAHPDQAELVASLMLLAGGAGS